VRLSDGHLGCGADFEFATTAEVFNEVVAVNVDRPPDLPALVERLSVFDAAVSIMNEALPPHWPIWHKGLVMVDSLAWLWPSPNFPLSRFVSLGVLSLPPSQLA
jgi:hypothetical protein